MSSIDLSGMGEFWAGLTAPGSLIFLVVLLLLVVPAAGRNTIALFRPFRSVRMFGAEFILNEAGARQGREEFDRYRAQVRSEVELQADRYKVHKQLEVVCLKVLEPAFEQCFGQPLGTYRATVHMEDFLFRESLIQIVNDYPRAEGQGQLKSVRFGLIGLAWRRLHSQTQAEGDVAFTERVDEWGMTQAEAKSIAQQKQFFSAVILNANDIGPVGIFYVDTPTRAVTVTDDAKEEFHRLIHEGCVTHGLVGSVAQIERELRGRSPMLSVYD